QPTAPSSERREGLTRTIQLGLAPYAARTSIAPRLRLSLTGDDDDESERKANVNDPWKSWVFEIGVEGSLDREERQRNTNVEAGFGGASITSLWKAGFMLSA